jgi:hypothetical protein
MLSRRWSLAVVLAALATAVIVGFAPLVATSECVASSSGGSGHVDEAAEVAARQEVDRWSPTKAPVSSSCSPFPSPSRRSR